MGEGLFRETKSTTEEAGLVSGRFLSDFFISLERHNVPARQMLGDLPIRIDEAGRVIGAAEWAHFVAFLKRLEHHVGGPTGLAACGEQVGELKMIRSLRSLAGFSVSPAALYHAAGGWALRRAMPGVEARVEQILPNSLEIRVRLKDGLRACPQLFHIATGGARALPRLLGMSDAVVSAIVGDFEAQYRITLPPSRSIWARVTRIFRSVFSAGSFLRFLEAQQLELHAKYDALQKAHAALAESERRYRAITDTAVDVLCELNEQGQIIYVSDSIENLLGYTAEQVIGSNFSLWVRSDGRDRAKSRFDALSLRPVEESVTRERLQLHSESGEAIPVDISIRSYRTPDGERRLVGILRNESHLSDRRAPIQPKRQTLEPLEQNSEEVFATTDRMARIVENALVQVPDSNVHLQWLESKTILDTVQMEFRAQTAVADLRLHIDAEGAPALIWSDETLFVAGACGLIEWAALLAAPNSRIDLKLETLRDRASSAKTLLVSVSASAAKASARDREPVDDALGGESLLSVALARLEDVASALGADLILRDTATLRPVGQIRLPQPK